VQTEELHIFLSHYHWDHIIGLWTLPRIGMEAPGLKAVHLYGKPPITAVDDLKVEPHSPGKHKPAFTVEQFELAEGDEVRINDAVVRTQHSAQHPNDGSRGYRLEANGKVLAYLTDMTVGEEMLPLAKDADLLICEANFLDKDAELAERTGHTTACQAAVFAKDAGVKQLALFHVNAMEDKVPAADLLAEAAETFPNTVLSEDGMVLTL
jgi:ribonuclease BN (tRNA processing enzyme)